MVFFRNLSAASRSRDVERETARARAGKYNYFITYAVESDRLLRCRSFSEIAGRRLCQRVIEPADHGPGRSRRRQRSDRPAVGGFSSNIAASLAEGGERQGRRYTRLVRLDDIPSVASTAAKRGLQNPDLLLFGEREGRRFIQGADAKFSIETARVKQVSPEVVEALLGIGPVIDQLLDDADRPTDSNRDFSFAPTIP